MQDEYEQRQQNSKEEEDTKSQKVENFYTYIDPITGKSSGLYRGSNPEIAAKRCFRAKFSRDKTKDVKEAIVTLAPVSDLQNVINVKVFKHTLPQKVTAQLKSGNTYKTVEFKNSLFAQLIE